MRILITCPTNAPHGGIRVILEVATRLQKLGHEITLYCRNGVVFPWFGDLGGVKVQTGKNGNFDSVIICSPHSMDAVRVKSKSKFLFMQMAEHLFRPKSPTWLYQCADFYKSPYPLFSISQWNIEVLEKEFKRKGETIYMNTGINTTHFPISTHKKGKFILVEGWDAINESKDAARVAARVAIQLIKEYPDYKILSYGMHPLDDEHIYEHIVSPSNEELRDLYAKSLILLKVSKYDARSCSPVEALSQGCVVVRGIIKGDDDLIHDQNCLRSGYSFDEVIANARLAMTDKDLRERLIKGGHDHLREHCNWDVVIEKMNNRLIQ